MPDTQPITVNVDNYVQAETSLQFSRILAMAKELNRFAHARRLVPLHKQHVVRMNRDTLYGSALVDISQGAQLTLPATDGRYLSVAVINQNNHTTAIHHGAGVHQLSMADHHTPFVALVARVLVDERNPDDLAIAHQLQDQITVKASAVIPWAPPEYDKVSQRRTHSLLQQLGEGLQDANGCNGKPDEVRETRHMLVTAFGWGGLPTYEVAYVASTTQYPVGAWQMTLRDVPVDGFWSISIYNRDGYFEENPYGANSLNSVTAKPDADGSVTLHFGSQPDGYDNFLWIMDGWSYNLRFYQPRAAVLDGTWQCPEPEPVGVVAG